MKRRRDLLELHDEKFHQLRADVRRRMSAVILQKLNTILPDYRQRASIPKESQLGKAIYYAMNQWETLKAFIDHPEVEIDSNAAERAIRRIALGRKNWMFAGSAKGGGTAAVLYSLIGSCKVLDIIPQAYLEDVLHRIKNTPESEISKLTPWGWAAEQPQS